MIEASNKIILFDGVCNLCNGTIQWIIARDKKNVYKFASLQSDFGQSFLVKNKMNPDDFESFILIDADDFYTKSTAVLKIARTLGGLYLVLSWLLIVPKPLRDWFYTLVANNRYQWFGKQKSCWLPTPELQEKFL